MFVNVASSTEPLAVLARQVGRLFPDKETGPVEDYYVTRVYKCDGHGMIKEPGYLFYQRESPDLEKAKAGHKETLDLLMQGRLPLKRQREDYQRLHDSDRFI